MFYVQSSIELLYAINHFSFFILSGERNVFIDRLLSRSLQQVLDCSALCRRMQKYFAVRLMSVLLVNGYMQLMRTATEDIFQSSCRQAGATPLMKVVLTIRLACGIHTGTDVHFGKENYCVSQSPASETPCAVLQLVGEIVIICQSHIFYRATACNTTHGIAKAFLSVCVSVYQTIWLWQYERNLCPYSYTTWMIIPLTCSFLTRRMVGGRRPLLPEILGQTDPVGAKTPIFNRYLLVAPPS